MNDVIFDKLRNINIKKVDEIQFLLIGVGFFFSFFFKPLYNIYMIYISLCSVLYFYRWKKDKVSILFVFFIFLYSITCIINADSVYNCFQNAKGIIWLITYWVYMFGFFKRNTPSALIIGVIKTALIIFIVMDFVWDIFFFLGVGFEVIFTNFRNIYGFWLGRLYCIGSSTNFHAYLNIISLFAVMIFLKRIQWITISSLIIIINILGQRSRMGFIGLCLWLCFFVLKEKGRTKFYRIFRIVICMVGVMLCVVFSNVSTYIPGFSYTNNGISMASQLLENQIKSLFISTECVFRITNHETGNIRLYLEKEESSLADQASFNDIVAYSDEISDVRKMEINDASSRDRQKRISGYLEVMSKDVKIFLFGTGRDNGLKYARKYDVEYLVETSSPNTHSSVFDLLVFSGVLGGGVFIVSLVMIFKKIRYTPRKKYTDFAIIIVVFTIINGLAFPGYLYTESFCTMVLASVFSYLYYDCTDSGIFGPKILKHLDNSYAIRERSKQL